MKGAFPIVPVLFCIFLTLKLTGHIDWSWWWVTAPFWMCFVIMTPIVLFVEIAKAKNQKRRRW